MNAEKFENKRFETFFQDKLVKDKKSFLELFCQARLITVNEKKKKFLKPLSAVMEVCQAFDLLVKKAVEFTGAFKYAITLVPLAVATPQSPLYQPDKIGLRNYIISLSQSSGHKYPRDVKWMVDGLAAIRSVPPPAKA